ncbi:MAG: AMP-dependent synthetase, partial [Pseudomonadota bacterium]
CTAVPVKDGVTVVGAFIVPASPEQTMPSDAELAAFAADRLAGYKCPRHWCVIDALPRTANGKLQRKALSA